MMRYIFDTNVWIAARNEVYAPRVFPCVWARIEESVQNSVIVSPKEVIGEATKHDDEVKKWISAWRRNLTAPLLASDLAQEVENSVPELRSRYPALSHKPADYYVVAWGKALGWPIVTLESPASSKKIPAVCRGEGVNCFSPLEFMQQQGWEFRAS